MNDNKNAGSDNGSDIIPNIENDIEKKDDTSDDTSDNTSDVIYVNVNDENTQREKAGKVELTHKKTSIHLSIKQTVTKRIDESAYRAGMPRHTFIEKALEYAIKHELNVNRIAQDPAIRVFLRPKKDDTPSNACARVYPEIVAKIEKIAKRRGLTEKDFIDYAVAYYAIYVQKVFSLKNKKKNKKKSS